MRCSCRIVGKSKLTSWITLAEALFLVRLHCTALAIYQVLPTGADIVILSDGRLYAPILGVDEEAAQQYVNSIARIHREHPDFTLEQVVVEAASTRLRPILLTTVVTVIGMVPLTLASAFWAPLAFSIMAGLAFSLLLTLMLIPMLYYRWPGKKSSSYARNSPPRGPRPSTANTP
jgi:hypothetical protein